MGVGAPATHASLSRDLAACLPGATEIFEDGLFLFSEAIDMGAREGWFIAQGWDTQEEEGRLRMASFGSERSLREQFPAR